MSEEKKNDEETQKFYEENKEMIDRIIAQRTGSDDPYLAEAVRRAAFERRMRLEYEAEKARRAAFEKADEIYADAQYARDRTEEAFEEARDHIRSYSRDQADYFYDMMTENLDRARENARRRRQYFRDRYEEDRAAFRESREHARQMFNDGFDEFFAPFTDEQFQKHVVGAGLEFWMALTALIRAAPLPDSLKDAFVNADLNKNSEFCSKNPECRKKPASAPAAKSDEAKPKPIKITPVKKEKK